MNLRRYILGLANDKEAQEIEESLMLDEDFAQEFNIVESEIIQDFVDEKLSLEEKTAFEKNFILTKERREQINFSQALRKFVDEKNTQNESENTSLLNSLKSFFLSPIPALCGIALVIGITTLLWYNYAQKSEILVALNKYQKNERPTDARISDFDYAPKVEGTRGANDKQTNLDLELAKSLAIQAVDKNRNAKNLHSLGQVFLAEKKYDDAIKNFEEAIKLNSNISKLHNDLGVALMEKGKQKEEGKLELLAKANEEISKAIELDKTSKEALFNSGLVIEALNLPNQAKEAWENYLKLDSDSKWADEARERLKKLEENRPVSKTKEEILRDFLTAKGTNDTEKAWQILSRNREMITGKLIPQQLAFLFVDSKSIGDENKAKEALDALVYVGNLEVEKSGDLFWRDLADYYTSVSDQRVGLLKQGQDLLKEGILVYQKGDYEKATQIFIKSRNINKTLENVQEIEICSYWIGSSLFYSNQIVDNIKIYEELADFCQKKNYKWLLAQSYARLGYSYASLNKISDSLSYPKKSLALAKILHDEIGERKFSAQIAEEYKRIGRFEESSQYLTNLLKSNNASLKWLDYEILAGIFFKRKFYQSSLLFEKEALAKAIEDNSEVNQQISKVNLAIVSASQEKYEEAEEFIFNSLRIAHKFNDIENREKSIAYAKLQLAHILRQKKNWNESLRYYDESIKFYDSSEFSFDKYDANKGRLLCFFYQDKKERFQNELPNVLKIFESYRTEIFEEQNRNSFIDDEQDVYDIAIDFFWKEGKYEEALNYAEKSRARALLDLQNSVGNVKADKSSLELKLSGKSFEPLPLDVFQKELPDEIQLIEYAVLEGKVIIWLVEREQIRVAQVSIDSEVLQEQVAEYVNFVSTKEKDNAENELSKKLYQTLVIPIAPYLASNKKIIIIPDKFLFQIPFSSLRADKYLIEDYDISIVPSANVFLICSKKAKKLDSQRIETLLSIGNPTFNKNLSPDLDYLPMSENEARKIAGFYDKSVVLANKEATKSNVKNELQKANVFHYAGHYVPDSRNPMESSFILAGENKESATLSNYEMFGEDISKARLIILSACQTGVEKYYGGEGMIGASRTFLANGVPLVIASQWKVDSESSAELMIDFHHRRKIEGLSTSEALRQAQLSMMKNEKYQRPYYWAAFAVFGGYAKF